MVRKRRLGTGSIYKRASDGRWVATISRGPRGARQVRTAYRRTKAGAEAALDELRARHGPMNATMMTVGAFLERWVREARDIRPTTRHSYEVAVTLHIIPALGAIRLADLSPLHVESMLNDLAPKMTPKYLRNTHAVLRRALGQAVRADLVQRNVAAREFVDAPKVTIAEPDSLTVDELKRLLPALTEFQFGNHVIVALGTGLRLGEQLGLAWEDVDLDAGTLRVRKELARVNGKYKRVDPKTPRSRRTVPLSPRVVEAFRAHREQIIAQGFAPIATGPVFINTTGGPLHGSWLTHSWYKLLESIGIKRRPWKVLRATFGSRLFAEGVPDRTVADILGHSRTHTTHRHYISSGTGDVTEALARVVG